MRSFDPKDESDVKEIARLNCAPWMVRALSYNPGYPHWGPHEDYMIVKGEGWNTPLERDTWAELDIPLDDYNEVVNFYFYLHRDSKQCDTCGGNGHHPDAQWVSESWYSHTSPFRQLDAREEMVKAGFSRMFGDSGRREIHGHGTFPSEATLTKYGPGFRAFCEEMRVHGSWNDRLSQEEVDLLVSRGRLLSGGSKKSGKRLTAADVNAAQSKGGMGFMSHDAINCWIVVSDRLKRFGIPEHCPECEGHGQTFTAPHGKLAVVLWLLHPRKGASRGVEVKSITRDDLPKVIEYLREAAKRNADRFAKLPTEDTE